MRDAILAATGVGPGDTVLEIGPGTGVLTEALLRLGASVLAVELDRDLAALLRERLADEARLTLWVADALRFDLAAHLGDHPARGAVQVVANIPYNITSPLILRLLKHRELFSRLYLTVQREVAERLGATPGSKAYGALTLACQYWASVGRVLPIRRTAFYPVPEVDSTLVRFDLLEVPRVQVTSAEKLFGVIRAAFGQRRKMLRNALVNGGWRPEAVDAALALSGIAGDRRGERLSLEEFARLCEALPAKGSETDRDSDRDWDGGAR